MACDPYTAVAVNVSLDESILEEVAAGPIVTEWVIDFYPDNEAVETWDEIFHVRERWTNNCLSREAFGQWLESFRSFCRCANWHVTDDESVIEAVGRYAELQADFGFDDKAFLKAAFFRFLHRRCVDGSQRLILMLRDAASVSQSVV